MKKFYLHKNIEEYGNMAKYENIIWTKLINREQRLSKKPI